MPKKKTSRKRPAAKSLGRTSVRGRLSGVSTDALHAELRKRERRLKVLLDRRVALVAKLETLDAEIAEYERSLGLPASGGQHRTGVRKRPRNKMNLVEALHLALTNKTMSVTEVAEAVQKSGYRTTSPNFRTIVNQALLSNPTKFRKIARGQYTAE